jgi:NMD protein affecting ribosome stability and mRNA decay
MKGKLTCINLDTGKKTTVDEKSRLEVLAGPECRFAVISKRKPRLEVIHPDTYESVCVENSRASDKQKLRVLAIDGKIYEIR